MKQPFVQCLTSTYGRMTKLSEVVSCFIDQDYENKELIILNNHPLPICCDLPQVKIYNEPRYETLGDCRNRLIQLAKGDFIRTWDDDDLYMPWTLSQGVENIKDAVAWKPKKSWFWVRGKQPELAENVFEAAILIKTQIAKKYGYLSSSGGNEHDTLMSGIQKEGGCKIDEMGNDASYCYRWGWGMWHISGSLGSDTIENRTQTWCDNNRDMHTSIIEYVNVKKYWDFFPLNKKV